MVKTNKTKTKLVKNPRNIFISQLAAAQDRLDAAERFEAGLVTRLEIIEKHIDTISGKVNFITPTVGDNTTHTAQLDTIALTTAKDIEAIKSWKDDIGPWLNMKMKEIMPESEAVVAVDQDMAKLVGTVKTVSQKVEQLSDRIIRIERKFLLGKDIVLPNKESGQVLVKSLRIMEDKVDVHGKRLTAQAADIRMIQDSVRNLSQALDTLQTTITNVITTTTTNQSTSSLQPQS